MSERLHREVQGLHSSSVGAGLGQQVEKQHRCAVVKPLADSVTIRWLVRRRLVFPQEVGWEENG